MIKYLLQHRMKKSSSFPVPDPLLGITLQSDVVPVQHNLPKSGVDLQGLGQQSRPHIAHSIPTDVEDLETLIGPESVDHVVDISLQFAI